MGFFDGFFDVGKNVKRGARQAGDLITGAAELLTQGPQGLLNVVGGSGRFETFGDTNKRKSSQAKRVKDKKVSDLLELIKTDETISEVTRKELTSSILNDRSEISFNSDGTISPNSNAQSLESIDKRFKEAKLAKEGSVFASRQGTEELLKILKDKPGRSQFVSSGRSNSSLLGS